MENTFEELIGKITEIKPLILATDKEKKATAANTTAIKELQDSIANKGKRKDCSGGGKRGDSASKDKSNGPVNKEGYYLCGTCNKRHNGTCRLLSSDSNRTPTKKSWMSRRETKEYIKTMVSTKKRGKGKRRSSYSNSSSDSSSSSDEESWRSGSNGAEQMHVLASAGINPSDDNIDFEDDDLQRYWKQAKKWSKKQHRR